MSDLPLCKQIDPAHKLPLLEWLDKIDDIGEDNGFFEPLGPDHSAILIEAGTKLLVTFETVETARGRANSDTPLGWELIKGEDWSQLCILSNSETWFRHRAIYGFFDRLVDDGFFDDFDQVVFYGSGSAGYAAAAYSVVAPGATVIALQPQATLDPRVTEWETRFHDMRKVSFTDRYGYAPDMLEAANRAFILYDPASTEDAMHAALYTRNNVSKLRCKHLSGQIEGFLRAMDILKPLVTKAMNGNLKDRDFYSAFRERRDYLPYLRRFLSEVDEEQRPYLTALLCRSVLSRMNTPRFRRELTRAQEKLGTEGKSLPEARVLKLV